LPKFVHRKYASLVNIAVGTLLQIAQQKTAKTMKKIFQKKIISDLPTLIFSRYETGTTGIFLRLMFNFALAFLFELVGSEDVTVVSAKDEQPKQIKHCLFNFNVLACHLPPPTHTPRLLIPLPLPPIKL
jgi:hypothetical protein